MRRLALFLLVAGTVWAQPTIQNNEEFLAYYAGTQFSEEAVREALLAPDGGVEFLGTYLSADRYLPPLGALVDEEFTSRFRSVVGVFVRPESTQYPVFLVPADADFMSVSDEDIVRRPDGSALTVSPLDLRVEAERIVIDNRYLDWETIPDMLRSGPATLPRRARRVHNGSEENVAVEQALYWRKGGTELEGLKLALTSSSLYLGFDASRPMVEGLSLFVYVYPERPRGVAALTLEIPVVDPSGPILLWRRNADEPVVAGYYTVADFFLEGRIFREELPQPDSPDEVTMDIATTFFGSGVVEEFEYGTVQLRDVPIF